MPCILQNNPCQNNGQCMDDNGSYSCKCKNGYTGINCEIGKKTNDLKSVCFALDKN